MIATPQDIAVARPHGEIDQRRDDAWFTEPDVRAIDALLADPSIEVGPFRARARR